MTAPTARITVEKLLVIRDALTTGMHELRGMKSIPSPTWHRLNEARAILDTRLLCALEVQVELTPPAEPTFRDHVIAKVQA